VIVHKAEVQIVECPRDAMQGIPSFIPTEQKAAYINLLMKCGFAAVDFGSFVSPRAIPQMRDTAEVLSLLNTEGGSPLLAIVVNFKGAQQACRFPAISFLGFPFSVSSTFQLRNAHSTPEQSLETVKAIQQLCQSEKKQLVVYISMAFGNPYGDPWSEDLVVQWIERLINCGVRIISLADTVGLATPGTIGDLFQKVISYFPEVETGVHLHCRPDNLFQKIEAAWNSGCRRFDTAIHGLGGCPMAHDELVGNLATEKLIEFLEARQIETGIDKIRFNEACRQASQLFTAYVA
jgi:hydroxymethylglutaryl-CoA lyase